MNAKSLLRALNTMLIVALCLVLIPGAHAEELHATEFFGSTVDSNVVSDNGHVSSVDFSAFETLVLPAVEADDPAPQTMQIPQAAEGAQQPAEEISVTDASEYSSQDTADSAQQDTVYCTVTWVDDMGYVLLVEEVEAGAYLQIIDHIPEQENACFEYWYDEEDYDQEPFAFEQPITRHLVLRPHMLVLEVVSLQILEGFTAEAEVEEKEKAIEEIFDASSILIREDPLAVLGIEIKMPTEAQSKADEADEADEIVQTDEAPVADESTEEDEAVETDESAKDEEIVEILEFAEDEEPAETDTEPTEEALEAEDAQALDADAETDLSAQQTKATSALQISIFVDAPRTVCAGDTVTLRSNLDDADTTGYALSWQYNNGSEWKTVEGAMGTSHSFAIDETNADWAWRLVANDIQA